MTAAAEPLPPVAKPFRTRLLPVLALSLVAHLVIILLMIQDGRARAPVALREVPVELVQEVPPAPKAASSPKPAAPPKPPSAAAPKQAAAKPAPAQPKPPQPKPPQPKPPQPKPPQPKPPQPKPPQPKPPQPKPPQPKPPLQSPQPQRPAAKPAEHPAANTAAAPPRESVTQRMDRLLGPMPAVPLPAAAADGDESVSYKQIVLSQVAKAKKVGRYQGVPGAATVGFSIGADGALLRCEIVRKSVDPGLDAEALAMVRRAAPFPPPPPGGERDYVIGLRFQAM